MISIFGFMYGINPFICVWGTFGVCSRDFQGSVGIFLDCRVERYQLVICLDGRKNITVYTKKKTVRNHTYLY